MTLISMVQGLMTRGARIVVVGGFAASIQGSAIITEDLNVCYADDSQNLRLVAEVLREWGAYPRAWEPGLPFFMDERTFRMTPTTSASLRGIFRPDPHRPDDPA